jgi:hypothetical protein
VEVMTDVPKPKVLLLKVIELFSILPDAPAFNILLLVRIEEVIAAR